MYKHRTSLLSVSPTLTNTQPTFTQIRKRDRRQRKVKGQTFVPIENNALDSGIPPVRWQSQSHPLANNNTCKSLQKSTHGKQSTIAIEQPFGGLL
jgi:hypothetical protein